MKGSDAPGLFRIPEPGKAEYFCPVPGKKERENKWNRI